MENDAEKWGFTPLKIRWKATNQKVPAMWITAPDQTQYGLYPVNVEVGGEIRDLMLKKVDQLEPISGPLPLGTLPEAVRKAIIPTFKACAAELGYSVSHQAVEALRSGQSTPEAETDFTTRLESDGPTPPQSSRGR